MTSTPADAPHPFVDEVGEGYGVVSVRSPVVAATEWLQGAVRDVALAGLRPVILTPDATRLTFAARRMVVALGASWVVHDRAGLLRDGFTGRRYETIADVLVPPHPDDLAVVAHLRDDDVPRHPRLIVETTVLHKPRIEVQLGRAAEIVADRVAGAALRGWGTAEPAALHWNRENLTAFARSRMPEPTRMVFAADVEAHLSGTIVATRTVSGVSETVTTSIGLDGDAAAFGPALDGAILALAAIADELQPILGIVSGTWDRLDGLTSALVHPPLAPLALLIGPRAVRDLRIDVDGVVARFGATVAGRRRIPAVVVPFRGESGSQWDEFLAFGSTLAPDDLARAFGVAEQQVDHAS